MTIKNLKEIQARAKKNKKPLADYECFDVKSIARYNASHDFTKMVRQCTYKNLV